MIAEAAPEATPAVTLLVCVSGLAPLAYLVWRHRTGRPALRTCPGAFVRTNPMLFAVLALATLLLGQLAGWTALTTGPRTAIAAQVGVLAAGAVLYGLAVRRALRPQGTRVKRIGRGLLVLWALMPLVYGAYLLLQWLGFEESQRQIQWLAERRDGWHYIAVHAVLVAPVTEEISFRGLLYPALRQLRGPRYAILVTALAFGLIHILPAVVAPMVLFGLGMAWLCETNGSIFPCILGHIGFNALTVVQLLLV